MSYEKSDFKFDYQKLSILSNEFVDNLFYLKWRQSHINNASKIQNQIAELESSLEAETYFIANMVLNDNVFPRFGGYKDFIANEYFFYSSNVENERKTFGILATIVKNSEYGENEKDYEAFNAQLDNFIWLFFYGGGTIKTIDSPLVIDYEGMNYVSGRATDLFPSATEYTFNVFNKNSGNTYTVSFYFYDLSKALQFNRTTKMFPHIGQNSNSQIMIRNVAYGAIHCYVRKQKKPKYSGKLEYEDSEFIASHDPIEIAGYINDKIV